MLVAVQSAMPSAQNLVLLMQLRKSTQPLAPRMAALLLRIYALCHHPRDCLDHCFHVSANDAVHSGLIDPSGKHLSGVNTMLYCDYCCTCILWRHRALIRLHFWQ